MVTSLSNLCIQSRSEWNSEVTLQSVGQNLDFYNPSTGRDTVVFEGLGRNSDAAMQPYILLCT